MNITQRFISLVIFILGGFFLIGTLAGSAHAGELSAFDVIDDGQLQHLFTIQGSNTIGAQLAPNLVKAYLKAKGASDVQIRSAEKENEVMIQARVGRGRVQVKIAAHGSSTGFKALALGQADIAAASRPIKQKEVVQLQHLADMRGLHSEHVVGIDGIAMIVHKDNPINDLSVNEIAEIFSGGYDDWSQLGGAPGPITIYARDDQSGTWDSFKRMVLGKKYKLADQTQRFESNDDLSDAVAIDTRAIGFVGLTSVRNAKLLSVSDGSAKSLLPNKLTVATEDYALARRLYMYSDDDSNNPYVNDFIDFMQDYNGQKIVAQTGFISQNIRAVSPELYKKVYQELPEDFKQMTQGAKRLTINFRFKQGSARLDNKALLGIGRLVEFLQNKQNPEVVLIGFGDSHKSEKRTKLLSKLRAMAVRRELVRNGIYPKSSLGYGEFLPVASNNSSNGRIKNRRVEVWLRAGEKAAGKLVALK